MQAAVALASTSLCQWQPAMTRLSPETKARAKRVMGLGPETDLLHGGNPVDEGVVDLRRLLRRNLHPEGHAVDGPQGVQVPDGVPFGYGEPLRVLPLRLSPHVPHDVVREGLADGIGRSREALHQVRELLLGQIEFDRRLGPEDKGAEKQGDKGRDQ